MKVGKDKIIKNLTSLNDAEKALKSSREAYKKKKEALSKKNKQDLLNYLDNVEPIKHIKPNIKGVKK